MLLRLTDGATTVTLTSAPWLGATFFAAPADQQAAAAVETAVCVLEGTAAAIQAAVESAERLLWRAARRQATRTGPRVFVEWRPTETGEIARSELLAGRVTWSAEAARRQLDATLNTVEVALTWERVNYWEGAEVELELSATGQSAATGGRSINNSGNSWVTISGAQVGGAIDTPLRLELTNTAGAGRAYSLVHVACNQENDPANFTYLIEGEDASGGSSVANGQCSGGNARSVAVATSATLTWTLSAAMMEDASGAPFVVLARIQSTTGQVSVRPTLKSGGVTVWRANEVIFAAQTTPHLLLLGTMALPPLAWEAPDASIQLALELASTTSQTVLVDYLAFLPATRYRLLVSLLASVADGQTIVDNGVDGYAGVRSGSAILPVISPRGGPILLRPGATQRLYIFQHTLTDCVIGDTFTVRAWYRPRRLTL